MIALALTLSRVALSIAARADGLADVPAIAASKEPTVKKAFRIVCKEWRGCCTKKRRRSKEQGAEGQDKAIYSMWTWSLLSRRGGRGCMAQDWSFGLDQKITVWDYRRGRDQASARPRMARQVVIMITLSFPWPSTSVEDVNKVETQRNQVDNAPSVPRNRGRSEIMNGELNV